MIAVVNCFELCIFEILNTTSSKNNDIITGCELLWIMYLWNIEYNGYINNSKGNLLWIALNYVSLKYWIQQTAGKNVAYSVVNCFELCIFEILNTTTNVPRLQLVSCELLWIMYLWNIEYNVISELKEFSMLWIALNYVSLKYWIQLCHNSTTLRSCCELLWIMYLWNIEYNSQFGV